MPAAKKSTKKPTSTQTDKLRLKTLQQERDAFEKKLHRLHDRHDSHARMLEWAFAHPWRFALSRFMHRYVKRDQR